MKGRESGMPEEALWSQFFDPQAVLAQMELRPHMRDVAEFGCGYGTFTIPAARIVRGIVHAFDIEQDMIAATEEKVRREGLHNVRLCLRDFMAEGTGLRGESMDFAMLFNILHLEQPHVLLREAHRILSEEGLLAIVHWNYDPNTPRGPSMGIRPRPEWCRAWAEEIGFVAVTHEPVALPPYHYGLLLRK